MSSNKDNGEMMGIAIVAAIIGLAVIFLYAVAAFLALGLTVVAFCAWDKPRTIFGSVLTPAEARAFVGRGILGAILLPVFAVFCAAMFDLRIEDHYWPHIILGGYTLGSLGLAMMEADSRKSPQGLRRHDHRGRSGQDGASRAAATARAGVCRRAGLPLCLVGR